MSDDRVGPPTDENRTVDDLPGLARVAASAWWHTTLWGMGTSLKATRRLAAAATSPQSAARLADDVQKSVQNVAREIAGVTEIEERLRNYEPRTPVGEAVAAAASMVGSRTDGAKPALEDPVRARGKALLRRSADVRYEEDAHPAYARIVDELAPDEGRILRLFLLEGPQPAVDIRTGGPLGLVSSEMIAPGLSMIGARAGCRYVDRVPGYLNNLHRLGLIWFSRETLSDPHRYQVIEAQPDVLGAMKSVRFAKIVRRSIHLTPFGEDFCRSALEIDEGRPLPEHHAPKDDPETAQPPTPRPA